MDTIDLRRSLGDNNNNLGVGIKFLGVFCSDELIKLPLEGGERIIKKKKTPHAHQ